jgi:hypothetical protein
MGSCLWRPAIDSSDGTEYILPGPGEACAKNRGGERLSKPSAITSSRIDLGMVLADIAVSVG